MSINSLETRQSGTPVGLDNIGNSCFMNSLLQCYFAIPPLVKQVLQAKSTSPDPHCLFLKSLQILFTQLIGSIKKSVNPKAVLDSLAKASNSGINLGNQEDVGELHVIFVENLGLALEKCVSSLDLQIKRLFVGVHSVFIPFKNEKRNEKDVEFCPLIIENDEGDLISAWEKSRFNSISGYRRESGNLADIVQENWIKDLPEVLFFQIKRSIYVEGIEEMFKDCSGLEIPQVIYPDRMMVKNREIVLRLREETKDLLEEKKNLKEKLRLFYSFSDKNKLNDGLQTIIKFFASDLCVEFDPNREAGITYLKAIEAHAQGLASRLTNRINEIEEQIKTKYEEINKTPYALHSILVHEGIGNFGHYFALIKDYNLNIWRKHNDAIITLVTEEEVTKIVTGESEGKSAYCVLYINQNLLKSATGLPLITYELDLLNQSDPLNEYVLYVQNEELTNFVNKENSNYYNSAQSIYDSNFPQSNRWEIDKSLNITEMIFNEFDKKLDYEGIYIGKTASHPFKEIQSFSRFLYHNKGPLNFRRYAIMDFVCKSLTGKYIIDLDLSTKNELLYKVGNQIQMSIYRDEINRYSKFLRFVRLSIYILELLSKKKIHSSTRIFVLIFVTEDKLNDFLYNLVYDIFKTVLFELITELINTCKEKNIEKIFENCKCIHLLYSLYKDLGMVAKLDKLFIKIEKDYAGSFKGENKIIFLKALQLAKSQNLDTSFAVEQVLADSAEFNEEFENLDLLTFEDNGQINSKLDSLKGWITNFYNKYKNFTSRRTSDKELNIKDFD